MRALERQPGPRGGRANGAGPGWAGLVWYNLQFTGRLGVMLWMKSVRWIGMVGSASMRARTRGVNGLAAMMV